MGELLLSKSPVYYIAEWQLYLSLNTCILQLDFELHHNGQNRHHVDTKLTEELVKDAQDTRKRQGIKSLPISQSTDTVS